MEFTTILPLLSEIISHPGSFFEKAVLIVFAAVVFKIAVRKHFTSVEDQLKALNAQIGRITSRLDSFQTIHDSHEDRLDALEEKIDWIKPPVDTLKHQP